MSNPVTVTLSGNSTPLLPSEGLQMDLCSQCGVRPMHSPSSLLCASCELTSLRARLAEAEARAGRADEAVRVLGGEVEKQRHAANEWADTYYNAKQWLKNIAIGISTPAEAFGNLDKCEAHCKEVWDDACKPAARAAVEGAK